MRPDQQVAWRGDRVPDDPAALIDRVRGAEHWSMKPDHRIRIGAKWEPAFRMTNAKRLHAASCASDNIRSSTREASPSDAYSSFAAIDSIKETSWRCTVWSLILL